MGEEGDNIICNWIREEPRLKNVSAVRNSRVYLVDSDIMDRPTPRLVDALEILGVDTPRTL
jgi:iron complex transport system substrate-binding protein